MKDKMGQVLILFGVFCFLIPIGNMIRMQVYKMETIKNWKLLEVSSLTVSPEREWVSLVYEEIPKKDSIFAKVQFLEQESLPLYQGIEEKQLIKGLGHDPLSVLPGENGNCIIYGHREEFLWELRKVEVGQAIYIQTVYGTLVYEVEEIRVTDPQDLFIFKETEWSSLTLVTCYPFIYFGPIEQRFVVKANLIGKL